MGDILNNGRNQFAFLAQGKLVVYEYADGTPALAWQQDLGPTMVANWTQMELALGDPDHDGQTDLIVSRGYNLAPLLITIADTRQTKGSVLDLLHNERGRGKKMNSRIAISNIQCSISNHQVSSRGTRASRLQDSQPGRRPGLRDSPEDGREQYVIGSLTNNAVVTFDWQAQYLYEVACGPGGSVEGTAGGWLDEGTEVSNRAVADASCDFAGWSHAPVGMEADNPLVFALDDAWTNVTANFELKPATMQPGTGADGPPGLGVPGFPAGFTVVVERAERLIDPDWQAVGTLPPGATNWTDEDLPEEWKTLIYRLVE